jgi:hypothetical protein
MELVLLRPLQLRKRSTRTLQVCNSKRMQHGSLQYQCQQSQMQIQASGEPDQPLLTWLTMKSWRRTSFKLTVMMVQVVIGTLMRMLVLALMMALAVVVAVMVMTVMVMTLAVVVAGMMMAMMMAAVVVGSLMVMVSKWQANTSLLPPQGEFLLQQVALVLPSLIILFHMGSSGSLVFGVVTSLR